MPDIEIDGKKTTVGAGSTVMDAAKKAGIYIPHFCYHKKLSIVASCRMCLVEVEKAPKPMPACATPVTNGMKVFTHSPLAVSAQKAVMEFLLANHPLDCPVCDQGGECQLQDLAVGYGGTQSRFSEEKHITLHKNVGPLISMQEMSRCIHCTRCVRFGQEIAGQMELGMVGRNQHAEITSFIGRTVNSELSGNMIDLCPVGALTSKPFRYTARSWELQQRKTISPHDSVGANLICQVKRDQIFRVLPLENEAVNECWISDKERFAYPALQNEDRLSQPQIKQGGVWQTTDWATAIDYVAHGLKDMAAKDGGEALAALAAPHSTLEEMFLLQRLFAGLGSENISFRPRQSDFSAAAVPSGTPWLGLPLNELKSCDGVLIVGAFLRKDHPLITQRLRFAAKKGAMIGELGVGGDDALIKSSHKKTVAPAGLAAALAAIIKALAAIKKVSLPWLDEAFPAVVVDKETENLAHVLASGEKNAILLGNVATQVQNATVLHALAQSLAELSGASLGFLGEAANSTGAAFLATSPSRNIFSQPRQAYLLMNLEPELDCANPLQALPALSAAKMVVCLSTFKNTTMANYADVILPLAPFSETSGTFVNCEGRVQSFKAVVPPLGEARPGWKILESLAQTLGLSGFDFKDSLAVRDAAINGQKDGEFLKNRDSRLKNHEKLRVAHAAPVSGIQRIANVPIHFADPIARRSTPLQETKDAALPVVRLNSKTQATLGLSKVTKVRVRQSLGDKHGETILPLVVDDSVPDNAAIIPAAHPFTAMLGGAFDAVELTSAEEKA